MKEARAGVDGRDFEKMVSVEEEEEGFLAREEEFFPRGRPRMREAKMLRLLRNLLRCYTGHADERADQACVQASLRANCSIFERSNICNYRYIGHGIWKLLRNLKIETGEENGRKFPRN